MYYLFLFLSTVFTFFILFRVNQISHSANQYSLEEIHIPTFPSKFRCAVDGYYYANNGLDDDGESSTLDVCRIHDNDALSEIIVAIKGPKHSSPKLVVALIDTGADVSIIHPAIVTLMPIETIASIKPSSKVIRAVNGGLVRSLGEISLSLGIGVKSVSHDFLVLSNVTTPLIIGWDLMRRQGATINLRKGFFCLKKECVPLKHSLADELENLDGKAMNNPSEDIRILSREEMSAHTLSKTKP